MTDIPHVIILGVGFGGIGALKNLRDANIRITLIDKHDYHTFQPLPTRWRRKNSLQNKSASHSRCASSPSECHLPPDGRHEHRYDYQGGDDG